MSFGALTAAKNISCRFFVQRALLDYTVREGGTAVVSFDIEVKDAYLVTDAWASELKFWKLTRKRQSELFWVCPQ